MTLYERIVEHAGRMPARAALIGADQSVSYERLVASIDAAVAWLRARDIRVLAIDMANSPAWAVLDIAAMQANVCLVPLPPFFSASQVRHVLELSGAQAIISDAPARLRECCRGRLATAQETLNIAGTDLVCLQTEPGSGKPAATVPPGVHKVTFTSGTTGTPKGVMLAWPQMRKVVESLADATDMTADDRHLALMPLAVLLENIGGVYVPLWAGASSILLPGEQVGLSGSSGLDARTMTAALVANAASTVIFTPQTLQGLVETREWDTRGALALRFAAVGGAPVSPRLLQRAQECGLPVYEGYGLSECCSVVCLNTPAHNRPGSVGRPLPHVGIRIGRDGEVLIEGMPFAGYLGGLHAQPAGSVAHAATVWRSGDIGELDVDGYLQLTGRRRNVFITAFGRNVAPEWVESELTVEPEIAQAAVIGEARPFNIALLVPAGEVCHEAIQSAVARANQNLPDYARVSRWVVVDPFTPANGLLTGTGRIRRDKLLEQHRDTIESLFVEAQTS